MGVVTYTGHCKDDDYFLAFWIDDWYLCSEGVELVKSPLSAALLPLTLSELDQQELPDFVVQALQAENFKSFRHKI